MSNFTDQLYLAARPIWDAQLEHPFVRGLGDGSLDPETFKNWVRQDYLYLKEYSRMFAWGAAKSHRLESMGWYAKLLDLILNGEMALHRSYAERFQITLEELEAEEMWPTARAYTDFLVRTAADGDMADLVAALLPCAWGYAYVGEHLAEGGFPEDARYADWIRMYISPEFTGARDWLIDEMDRLAEGASEEKRARLTEIFVLSSRYEWMFWQMCWAGEQWAPVLEQTAPAGELVGAGAKA
jgi:thiaminase/transcriptional activator TenA